ncbi:MAG: chlorophyll synthesis pathway protein BchC [Gammaproteobacteria bacterium]|nr:chlorophyll synthesis pathway protein BchC [Gammaproteobacteria bacterium]
MKAHAVVLEEPERLSLRDLELKAQEPTDVVVEMDYSGISTGTERLLYTGAMPAFPGMGYPLVPGYESVGRISAAGPDSGRSVGETVFVPGASCYRDVRGLFGGTAERVVVPGARVVPLPEGMGEQGVLIALAATARHALIPVAEGGPLPELIIGHGVLGRLLARLIVASGAPPPVVWETNPERQQGARGYAVLAPDDDERRDYRCICDVSGDASLLDTLIGRLGAGGEIVLAGFYSQPLSFTFPPAFMREARIRVAAEWKPADLLAVCELLHSGSLDLDGLITHRSPAALAEDAYRTAFGDAHCLKMILDWRSP